MFSLQDFPEGTSPTISFPLQPVLRITTAASIAQTVADIRFKVPSSKQDISFAKQFQLRTDSRLLEPSEGQANFASAHQQHDGSQSQIRDGHCQARLRCDHLHQEQAEKRASAN